MAEICRMLLITLLLHLYWVPSGFSQSDEERGTGTEEDESFEGTFSLNNYSSWLKKYKIHLFNYAVEVNETVVIGSPVFPVPKGLHWSSLNMENELPASSSQKLGLAYSHYFDKFLKTYNKSWTKAFTFDRKNQFLCINQTSLGFADVYRVHVDENKKDNEKSKTSSIDQDFDVAITLMTYMNHECGFKSRPQIPKNGDSLILSCSVVVNGFWNASLAFRNAYDGSEISGEVARCSSRQPSVGSRICKTAKVKVETDILAYTCSLEFPPDQRQNPNNPMFENSKWTSRFNKEVICHFPKVYIEAIPSDVTLLCNNMPCGDAVEVNDTISCVAHGYPQPVFSLQIKKESSPVPGSKEDVERRMVEDIKKTEKYIRGAGFVKYSVEYSVRRLLSSMIGESTQLEWMGSGEDGVLGNDEESDLSPRRNFSEMIDIIVKQVQAFGRQLDGNSTTAAPENDEPLPEIALKDLGFTVSELESEIRAVGNKLLEKRNSSLPDMELDKLKQIDNVIVSLLSIIDELKTLLTEVPVPETHRLGDDEESEEEQHQLLDEVNDLIAQFEDSYNLDGGRENAKQIFFRIINDFEFPDLEVESRVFMDSDEETPSDDKSSTAALNPEETVKQSEETQSTSEPDSLSITGEISASTEESPASFGEADNDTVSDSPEEEGVDVNPDNTTDAGNDTKGIIKEVDSQMNDTALDYHLNDTDVDEPPSTTGLPQVTSKEKEVKEAENGGDTGVVEEGKDEEKEGEKAERKEEQQEEKPEEKGKENDKETIAGEGTTRESFTADELEHEGDGDVTSETLGTVEETIKSVEEYRVQAKDVGHIEVSCNVSNTIGWGYNNIFLQVSSPTEKPLTSTLKPTNPAKDKQTSPVKAETDEPLIVLTLPDNEFADDGKEVTDKIKSLQTLKTVVGRSEVTVDNKRSTRFPFHESQQQGTKELPEAEEDALTGNVTKDSGSGDVDFETTPADAKAGAAAGELFDKQNAAVPPKSDEGAAGGSIIPRPNDFPGAKSDESDRSKNIQSSAGRHVRTVLLELLLVLGVFLTLVEL